ncbi:MAG: methionine biosynthesis protein MetW [Candidatus Omnitrophota bacterium]
MTPPAADKRRIRPDHRAIAEMIEPGSHVLDLGCGDGDLLQLLKQEKNCRGVGVEIDERSIYRCIEKGLTVSHADINDELKHYADQRFDYIIINESLQQVLDAEDAVLEALRVGRQVIAGVPNFCIWSARLQIFFRGRVPKTRCLPYEWYNTPNIRFFSLNDFRSFCRKKQIAIEKKIALNGYRRIKIFPNLFAQMGIFLLKK